MFGTKQPASVSEALLHSGFWSSNLSSQPSDQPGSARPHRLEQQYSETYGTNGTNLRTVQLNVTYPQNAGLRSK
jgi:hypothetical protein